MSEDQKAGTTTQDDGDATSVVTGTPDAADGNAGETAELEALRKQKGQWLAEKENYEKAKQRLAEIEAQQHKPPTNGAVSEDRLRSEFEQAIAETRVAADKGDPVAKFALLQLEAQRIQWEDSQKLKRQLRDDAQFSAFDQEIRDEARKEYESGNYATPEAAKWAVIGKRSLAQQSDFQKKQEELEREKRVRETGERAGSPRPVLGADTKVPTISEREYIARMEQDDIDLHRAVESGRMKVLWGK